MKIVVDASVAILTVLYSPMTRQAEDAWSLWKQRKDSLYAPMLWLNEVTSVIHKTYMLRAISESAALDALEALLDLDIEWVPETYELCRSAFRWASRIRQTAAYDGFYLALAEQLQADFWTADKRLVEGARRVGATWAHSIEEAHMEI